MQLFWEEQFSGKHKVRTISGPATPEVRATSPLPHKMKLEGRCLASQWFRLQARAHPFVGAKRAQRDYDSFLEVFDYCKVNRRWGGELMQGMLVMRATAFADDAGNAGDLICKAKSIGKRLLCRNRAKLTTVFQR